MSTARSYRIRLATAEEREDRARRGWPCPSEGCTGAVTHFTGFDFTAGNTGRTGGRKTAACTAHAARFAARHGLKMPEEVSAR